MPIDVRMLEQMQRRAAGIPQGARCRKCGYEIGGLHPDGRCPECGSILSFDDRLVSAAPGYVTQLHIGAMLVEISLILTVLLIVGIFVGGAVQSLALMTGLSYGGLPVTALSLIGWWMLSTRDPGLGDHDKGHRSRAALRVLLAVSLVGTLVSIGLSYTMIQPGALRLLDLLLLGVSFAGFVVSMLYVRVLAGRIPDYALIEKAGNVLRLGVVGVVAIGALVVFGVIVAASGSPMGFGLFGCIGLILMFGVFIGMIVWFIMYLLLMDALRVALRKIRQAMPA